MKFYKSRRSPRIFARLEVDDKFPLFFEEDVNDPSSFIDQRLIARLFVPIQDRNPEEALLKIEDP
jgi:hypothetical protein